MPAFAGSELFDLNACAMSVGPRPLLAAEHRDAQLGVLGAAEGDHGYRAVGVGVGAERCLLERSFEFALASGATSCIIKFIIDPVDPDPDPGSADSIAQSIKYGGGMYVCSGNFGILKVK